LKVVFGKLFSKDIEKIKDVTLKQELVKTILQLESAQNLLNISNIVKIKGHPEAYRMRFGKYRIGFYYDGETIELIRFAKRSDIYKFFP
jgi:mRNA-degrading endonuclease RelE of RelBE toxin-antitoxin system